MKTFKPLLVKEYLIHKRNLANLLMGIGMPLAFFLLFSSIWGNSSEMTKEMVALYTRQYMVQMAAFSSLSFAFFSLPFAFQEDRTSHRFKAMLHSPIPLWQYYLVKILGVLVHFILAILVVFAVGAFVKGVEMTAVEWLTCAGLLFVGAICFMPFGVLLAHIKSSSTLSIVANILYMGSAILGGLWMPVSMFPELMQKIAKLTPTYHLNNIVTTYLAKDFSVQSLLILAGYAIIVLGIALAVGKKLEVK